jgi:hypothetical protein
LFQVRNPQPDPNGSFRCLTCHSRYTSQRDLFFHLKTHYEPDDVENDADSKDVKGNDNKTEKTSEQLCTEYPWLLVTGEVENRVIILFRYKVTYCTLNLS